MELYGIIHALCWLIHLSYMPLHDQDSFTSYGEINISGEVWQAHEGPVFGLSMTHQGWSVHQLCPIRGVSHNISCVSCLFKGLYGLIKGISCIMRGAWGLILGILGHMRGVSHPQRVCIMPQIGFMKPDQKRTRPPQVYRRLYHGNKRHHDRCCSSPRVCTTPQRGFMRPNHPD